MSPGVVSRVGVHLLMSLFAPQGSYGGYVYTYAVKSDVHMSTAEGAFLTSVFWVSHALELKVPLHKLAFNCTKYHLV